MGEEKFAKWGGQKGFEGNGEGSSKYLPHIPLKYPWPLGYTAYIATIFGYKLIWYVNQIITPLIVLKKL